MAEEFTEKLIEKVREYVFLYDTGHPEYKKLVKKKAEAWRDISFFFYNALLTEEEVLQHPELDIMN